MTAEDDAWRKIARDTADLPPPAWVPNDAESLFCRCSTFTGSEAGRCERCGRHIEREAK